MKIIIFILISAFLSLTIISCGDSDDSVSSTSSSEDDSARNTSSSEDDSASSTSSSGTSQSFVDSDFCNFKKNTTSRNDSLIVTPTSSRHAEQSGGRLLYVDKSALSQYQTDNYLLSDLLESKHTGSRFKGTCYSYAPVTGRKYPCDAVDLSFNAPSLGNQFTQELRFKIDNKV